MNYIFKDRNDAAKRLADKLKKYKNEDGVILAIPRGGVPIGYYIAEDLDLPLEIVLSKKIGHPNNSEFAIGSVSLQGVVIDESVTGIPKDYIERESNRILEVLEEKFKLFMGDCKLTDLKNRTVIIVDDGVATGNTIMATINAVKKSYPKKIIVAVPVSPIESARKLSVMVDEFICLQIPKVFFGVGQFYDDFSQVSDEEVMEYLKKNQRLLKSSL
jgi:predicted phosphoribosyltransferase